LQPEVLGAAGVVADAEFRTVLGAVAKGLDAQPQRDVRPVGVMTVKARTGLPVTASVTEPVTRCSAFRVTVRSVVPPTTSNSWGAKPLAATHTLTGSSGAAGHSQTPSLSAVRGTPVSGTVGWFGSWSE
jgi:hypothetical protein